MSDNTVNVLFLCVHNAGRSQMAAAFLQHYAAESNGDKQINVYSAGSAPAEQINLLAVQAMLEVGIDMTGRQPKILTPQMAVESDVIISMGCGDTCPIYPGKRYETWELADPASADLAGVRKIRDEIKTKVQQLITSF